MGIDMMSIAEAKKGVRKQLLEERKNIPALLKEQKSHEICEQLISFIQDTLSQTDYVKIEAPKKLDTPCCSPRPNEPEESSPEAHPFTLGAYAPLAQEVDIHEALAFAYTHHIRICFPCMHTEPVNGLPFTMRAVTLEQYRHNSAPFVPNPLKRFVYRDAALEEFAEVSPQSFDGIIIPLVGFDSSHKRLGYGGGNYDRFLARVPSSCRLIGVGFREQYRYKLPTDGYDIALDTIIHDE